MVKYNFTCDHTIDHIERKRKLRSFRKMMGDLEKEYMRQSKKAQLKDLNVEMKNAKEIYNKKNVQVMESKLNENWNNERRFIDTNGSADDILYSAPTNDIQGIKTANTNALNFTNQLNPSPELTEQQKQTEILKSLRDNRRKKNRALSRLRNDL